MPTQRKVLTGRMVIAALAMAGVHAAVSASALAQAAGTGSGLPVEDAATGVPAPKDTGSLAQVTTAAGAAARSGRLVEAKAMLTRALRSAGAEGAGDAEQARALDLLKSVENRLRYTDAVEVSLQKAELAIKEGDLNLAEMHLKAVNGRASVKADQRERAEKLLAGVATRRNELAPLAADMLRQAVDDFEAGRYPQAKAALASVARSGVTLSPEQAAQMDRYQLRLVELERMNGRAFSLPDDESGMGMLQPGTVRRTKPKETVPAPEQPAEKPAQPPEKPAPAPKPPEQPAPQPPTENIISQAMRAEAQRLLAEADQAYNEDRLNEAKDKYTLSTTQNRQYLSAEELKHAEERLAQTLVKLGSNQRGDIGPGIVQAQKLRREAATAEFNNDLEQANRALAAGDTGQAREAAARARLTISGRRTDFTETEYGAFIKQVEGLNRKIETAAEEIRIREAKATDAALAKHAQELEARTASERDRKINESIDRARALQQEQKYEEALQVVDQILFLDPNNPSGLLLHAALEDIIIYRRYYEMQLFKQKRHVGQRLDNEEAMVPPEGIMDYPLDWPAKSFQRGDLSAYAETPANRGVLAALEKKTPTITLADNSLSDVMSFIKTTTQLNMDVDWDSLAEIGVDKDTPVSLNLSQVPVRVVLDRVLAKVSKDQFTRAGWAVNDGVLLIASEDQLKKNKSLVIYNIQDLLFEIPNYTDVPQIDLQSLLQQSQGGGGGGGGRNPFRDDQRNQQAQKDELDKKRQERITRIQEIIQSHVDPEGWVQTGGDTGTMDELNGSLIIRNTPKNHREIVGLLSKLREIRSMQINVETKFLLVSQDWFEQIGFDVDLVLNANNNQVRAARNGGPAGPGDPFIQASDFFDFTGSGGATRGIRRVVSAGTSGIRDVTPADGLAESASPQSVVPPSAFTPIGLFQDSLGLAGKLAEGDFATKILGSSPALGISGQFMDDVQVDFLLQATQADKRTVTLTAPRLTFTNGQTANIFVVTQVAFVSDLMPVVGDSAVGFNPTVSVASEGVTMLLEGVISSDRRYVTLNVDAGIGKIQGFADRPVTAIAGGQLVNSAATQSFIQLPTITVTRVRTTVTVPDEGTVLLGGQRLVTELEIETGVPVLSKIPIINRFFTNRIESKEEQTLLILVKPTIMIQTEEEEKHFPGLSDSLRSELGSR